MMFTRLGCLGLLFITGCLSRPLAEVSPSTSNLYVDQIKQTAIDKIDLLFMIDNSQSMTDKQEILREAIPVLLSRLVTPICVDGAGKPTGVNALPNGQCPNNQGRPEFNPIGDIHIGVVTSSLGAHGGEVCKEPLAPVVNPDDKAHLVGSMRPERFPSSGTWNNSGFLAWDSSGKANSPAGTQQSETLISTFQDMIKAVGEYGCGYEASLESWYRFLVDPEPPAQITTVPAGDTQFTVRGSTRSVNADGTLGACVGCDDVLLAQRKAFLRPDSLVAIVMLSDENDCSIRDESVGWFVGSSARMPRSTSQCAANSNDPCCRSCAQKEGAPPPGCPALKDDAVCKDIEKGYRYSTWKDDKDTTNLRCYNQHQRFGFDLLYGTDRYVEALTSTKIRLQSTGEVVTNPLFDNTGSKKAARDPSLVFLAGIVGVPWQDIADEASLKGPGLTYLTAKELNDKGRWHALLGDPSASPPVPPSDPFMIETPEQRHGENAIAKVSIAPWDTTTPNVINGHEQKIPAFNDLQYACTFPLKMPKVCAAGDPACDCAPSTKGDLVAVTAANSPLCQQGAVGPVSATQTSAKAYPGTRELQVLKDLGENAIVASICPKVLQAADPDHPAADPNYGYNPAVSAILERLKISLAGKCLPRAIKTDEQGQVLCRVVEAQKEKDACNCQLDGRAEVIGDAMKRAVRARLAATGQCDVPGKNSCNDWCMCEIKQVDSAHLRACQANQGGVPAGYCYVDDQAKVGADANTTQAVDAQLALCPQTQRHRLRFVDSDPAHQTPAQGAFAFIACVGDAITNEAEPLN